MSATFYFVKDIHVFQDFVKVYVINICTYFVNSLRFVVFQRILVSLLTFHYVCAIFTANLFIIQCKILWFSYIKFTIFRIQQNFFLFEILVSSHLVGLDSRLCWCKIYGGLNQETLPPNSAQAVCLRRWLSRKKML